MNNVGGGVRGADVFPGNRDALPTPEKLESELPQTEVVTERAMSERGDGYGVEQMTGAGVERELVSSEMGQVDPRIANAVGIVTVGATGVMPEREVREQTVALPTDNRTMEEVAIGAPEVARDGDRMEKEWMDRAREVVRETKNDPNGRLLKVARLREDYMRKRFNRILGERNDA